MLNTYTGFNRDWAYGRLKWANDALDHIDQYGLVPGDCRPYTIATDLPIVCDALGNLADEHPTVIRIKTALASWGLEPIRL